MEPNAVGAGAAGAGVAGAGVAGSDLAAPLLRRRSTLTAPPPPLLGVAARPPLTLRPDGLELAATCTIADLTKAGRLMPGDWLARPLFVECCTAFLSSFPRWNRTTVADDLGAAVLAGPVVALASALDAICQVRTPSGRPRLLPLARFVAAVGPLRPAVRDRLHAVQLPVAALRSRTAFRAIALSRRHRPGAVIVGRVHATEPDVVRVTVTSATARPVRVEVPVGSSSRGIGRALDRAVATELFLDDSHGGRGWRREVTQALTDEIVGELSVPEEAYPETELDGPHEAWRARQGRDREPGPA